MSTTKKKPVAPKKAAAKAPGTTSKRVKGAKAPKAKAPKGPRVIGSIVEFLRAAAKDKPLSKEALLDKLAKRFPDRDADAMRKTINCQLGKRIEEEQNLKLHKGDDGYWAT